MATSHTRDGARPETPKPVGVARQDPKFSNCKYKSQRLHSLAPDCGSNGPTLASLLARRLYEDGLKETNGMDQYLKSPARIAMACAGPPTPLCIEPGPSSKGRERLRVRYRGPGTEYRGQGTGDR